MPLGKLHVDIERNWSAKGHAVHYVVYGSDVSPHRIKIDEEEGVILVTHELGVLLVSCTTLTPIQLISTPHISQTSSLLGTVLWTCVSWTFQHYFSTTE